MRSILLATTLALMVTPVWADNTATTTTTSTTTVAAPSGPQEVGSTTMPPGQYYITEQISHKSYSLTVTDKGNMILGAAPDGVEVKLSGAAAAAATATAATTKPASLLDSGKGLLKQGMEKGAEKGMSTLVKDGASKELGNFMK
ncbi:MAG TPA: hypothetical protein V6C69_20180 [Trichormus sp.]